MLSLRSILRAADLQLTCGCDGTRQILLTSLRADPSRLKSLRMTPSSQIVEVGALGPFVRQLTSG